MSECVRALSHSPSLSPALSLHARVRAYGAVRNTVANAMCVRCVSYPFRAPLTPPHTPPPTHLFIVALEVLDNTIFDILNLLHLQYIHT